MEFNELMSALSEHLGGAVDLNPGEDGVVNLSVDDMRLSLIGMDDIASVVFLGIVGAPPPEDRLEKLYKALLEANHLFAGTGGATFSSDPETGDITLCRTLPYATLTGESFCVALTRFVNTLESWIRLVADFRAMANELTEPSVPTIDSKFLVV